MRYASSQIISECATDIIYQMQNMSKEAIASANRPAKLTILNTFAFIYKENGIKGLYRGVTPRIGLGIWQTVCMVSFAAAQCASAPLCTYK